MSELDLGPDRTEEGAEVDDAAGFATPKVLLVDDNRNNLVALEAILNGLDVEVAAVESGQEALRWLSNNDAAAILLDVVMPDLDGFDTAKLIRLRPRSQHTPILFVTGLAKSDQQRGGGLPCGGAAFSAMTRQFPKL